MTFTFFVLEIFYEKKKTKFHFIVFVLFDSLLSNRWRRFETLLWHSVVWCFMLMRLHCVCDNWQMNSPTPSSHSEFHLIKRRFRVADEIKCAIVCVPLVERVSAIWLSFSLQRDWPMSFVGIRSNRISMHFNRLVDATEVISIRQNVQFASIAMASLEEQSRSRVKCFSALWMNLQFHNLKIDF